MRAFLWDYQLAMYQLEPDVLHTSAMAGWLNDDEVTKLLFAGLYPADHKEIQKEWKQSLQDPDEIVFMVYADDEFVGTAGLYVINWVARTAEFRIFLGDKNCWGRGAGTGATRLVLDYAFNKLNLQMVGLGVNVENKAAVRVYEKAGFVHEGRLRRVQYRNGRYYDVYRMSILQEEFNV